MRNLFLIFISITIMFAFAGCNTTDIDSSSKSDISAINTVNTENVSTSGSKAESTIDPSILNAEVKNDSSQNTIYLSKEEFLDSAEGHSFQITAYKFAKAFFSKNTNIVKNYLIDPNNAFQKHSSDYGFDDVEFMILKLSLENIKKDSVTAEYEFKLNNEDSYTYLFLDIRKVKDEWKIKSYGLEK